MTLNSLPLGFSQQLGYMKHKKGDIIQARASDMCEIKYTRETLFIITLGGHGFEFLEES